MNLQRLSSVTRLILLLVIIAFILVIDIAGINITRTEKDDIVLGGVFEKGTIRLGLDLAGGSSITYEAVTEDTGSDLARGMESVRKVLENRLYSAGFSEALIYIVGDDRVTVEIPSVSDPAEAVEYFMSPAVLEFRNADGDIILTGADVKGAYPSSDEDGKYVVSLEFTDKGAELFGAATTTAYNDGSAISIYLDEELISSATVKSGPILDGRAQIGRVTGSYTYEEVSTLANLIMGGALEYELVNIDQRTIGATLGEKSLTTSIKAGLFGIILVAVFMILYYRIPGLVASVALAGYMALFLLLINLLNVNLTLPGIAGIVLSIGMAVDANVVIFERIKEELSLGKSTKAAIEGGFQRALSALIDSSVTTMIAAGVLYFLGSGSIKGFATTLAVGTVISFITAIFLTRTLLRLVTEAFTASKRLYGLKKGSTENA